MIVASVFYFRVTEAPRALKAGLNISRLPDSVEFNYHSINSWTDYSFQTDFFISPEDFEKLLEGGEFEEVPVDRDKENDVFGREEPIRITGSGLLGALHEDYEGWPYSELWHWEISSASGDGEYHGSHTSIFTNTDRTRAFVSVFAD